ncbi:ATP-binding protein [Bacillus sp. FJAT-45350]|uniref:ATP-binding protein n=1 Tax=Bacillus sp. FJAT-45350 TaxID=2011014 RepID=UPI0015C85A41|nr:ATP-binding protein [Bacillus sp. FJAT-45350]
MKRILDKVLKKSTVELHVGAPSLPVDLSYTELTYMTRRGFLAQKLHQYLSDNNSKSSLLFFRSLSKISFNHKQTNQDHEQLLYISELMLEWCNQGEDIPTQVKKLEVRNDIQNAMLKAYDIHKKDLFEQKKKIDESITTTEKSDPIWMVYKDVIFSVTQGQFLLISEQEVSKYKQGKVYCEGIIRERSDIPRCRNQVKDILEQKEFNKAKVMSWLLALSEAITNTLKHAEEGKLTMLEDKERNEIRFVIEDKGPGFSLEELPKTTLLAGYSTKKSMGHGFSLMMKMTKQVLLYTSPIGSTLILTIDYAQEVEGKSAG